MDDVSLASETLKAMLSTMAMCVRLLVSCLLRPHVNSVSMRIRSESRLECAWILSALRDGGRYAGRLVRFPTAGGIAVCSHEAGRFEGPQECSEARDRCRYEREAEQSFLPCHRSCQPDDGTRAVKVSEVGESSRDRERSDQEAEREYEDDDPFLRSLDLIFRDEPDGQRQNAEFRDHIVCCDDRPSGNLLLS